ncbi:MAG: hypothetical protein RR585_08700 [Coprobacillus sp.]
MSQILLGNKDHGCLVDNKILEYYDLMSLFEKMNGENHSISINYEDIDSIDIGYSLVNSNAGCSATITLCVHHTDGHINDIPLFFAGEEHDKYVQFAETLLHSDLNIHDPQQILQSIIVIKNKPIGTILFELDKNRHKK